MRRAAKLCVSESTCPSPRGLRGVASERAVKGGSSYSRMGSDKGATEAESGGGGMKAGSELSAGSRSGVSAPSGGQ